jgi:hypothetical protein
MASYSPQFDELARAAAQAKEAAIAEVKAAWQRCQDMVNQCPLDSQTKEALIAAFKDVHRSISRLVALLIKGYKDKSQMHRELANEAVNLLLSTIENQQKGPQAKRELAKKRHEVMRSAIAQGFTDENELYNHMRTEHDDLMLTNGRLISKRSMMAGFRKEEAQRSRA